MTHTRVTHKQITKLKGYFKECDVDAIEAFLKENPKPYSTGKCMCGVNETVTLGGMLGMHALGIYDAKVYDAVIRSGSLDGNDPFWENHYLLYTKHFHGTVNELIDGCLWGFPNVNGQVSDTPRIDPEVFDKNVLETFEVFVDHYKYALQDEVCMFDKSNYEGSDDFENSDTLVGEFVPDEIYANSLRFFLSNGCGTMRTGSAEKVFIMLHEKAFLELPEHNITRKNTGYMVPYTYFKPDQPEDEYNKKYTKQDMIVTVPSVYFFIRNGWLDAIDYLYKKNPAKLVSELTANISIPWVNKDGTPNEVEGTHQVINKPCYLLAFDDMADTFESIKKESAVRRHVEDENGDYLMDPETGEYVMETVMTMYEKYYQGHEEKIAKVRELVDSILAQ